MVLRRQYGARTSWHQDLPQADAYAQMGHAGFGTQKQAALHVLTVKMELRTLCVESQLKKSSDIKRALRL